MTTWREFWDSAHSIYVSDRHKDVHYRDVAEQLAAFVPRPDARVLDYGCGEAIHAGIVAERARELLLCDAAASVRAAIAARFAGNPKIKVLAPEDVERLPDASLDLDLRQLAGAVPDRSRARPPAGAVAPPACARRHAHRRRRDPAAVSAP